MGNFASFAKIFVASYFGKGIDYRTQFFPAFQARCTAIAQHNHGYLQWTV